jgi:hypothetical protein
VLLLVPLLPQQKPLKTLPAEIWADIFAYVLASGRVSWWWLAEVCKTFHVSEGPPRGFFFWKNNLVK